MAPEKFYSTVLISKMHFLLNDVSYRDFCYTSSDFFCFSLER
jgi:hypothetical protein